MPRSAIAERTKELAAEFTRHGRTPDYAEETQLFARANLETRQRKHAPRSEADQHVEWWREATAVLGGQDGIDAMLTTVGAEVRDVPWQPSPALDRAWIERTAQEAIETVSTEHSTWRPGVVRAVKKKLL